ncbi:type II toxin-antitoxin system RelE/ParE family toxin [Thiorhodovibrio frisius]|uniref:type II toxin-antitoxin system RelE/ParE family toxin n=1 Tax=Thiorhodovibrio frisius TaxID=631362 RepID=UPI00022C771E|nr:type II toxin-antitoxin system RelE/ParE family toxin [Thiorhodovibrio frisius]WPL23866.1 Toxin ParE1 [Thiorhodovibrio frisius]
MVQADRYLDELNEGMATLAENPRFGADCGWIRAGYRCLAIRHHIVYYRVTIARIEIIRILHERMDPKRHLGSSGPEKC